MPEYDFQNTTTGERTTLHFPMSIVPSIGEEIEVDGVRYRRIVSSFRANGNLVKDRWPVVSKSLPKKMPGFKHAPDGSTVITGRKDVDRAARFGYQKEN